MRIESNRVSPLVSDEVDGSRTSLQVMPRIWHAAMNERNVRVDGCVKYSIARLWWSRRMRKSCPPRIFDRHANLVGRAGEVFEHVDRELPAEDDVPRAARSRSNSGIFIRTGRSNRDS